MVVSALHTVLQEKLSYSSWIMVVRERGKCYYNLATICKNAFFFLLLFFTFKIWGGGGGKRKEKNKIPEILVLFYYYYYSTVRESEKRKFRAPYTTIVRW